MSKLTTNHPTGAGAQAPQELTTMPQPKHLIEHPRHFIEAMYDLADHGAIVARATNRDLLNIAEHFAEIQASEYEDEARKLTDRLSDLPGDTPIEFGLRLSGKHSSGSPICSIAWSQPTEPTEPTQEPTEPEPELLTKPSPHPFYAESQIRRHLATMNEDEALDTLTSLLAARLLDRAADCSDNPLAFSQEVSRLARCAENQLERKMALSE